MAAKINFKKIKPPHDSMEKYYQTMFNRNQSKWMRRSKMEPSHLGIEFDLEGSKYSLIGSATSTEVVIKNIETGEFFMTNIDPVSASVLGTE
tara:strand:+ start:1096 stop:1371 length:276 start_codon:yes stop_codon:yes gene_type:complete